MSLLTPVEVRMVETFVCPGCVVGSNTKCGSAKLGNSYGAGCENHVLGTSRGLQARFALGMPKGFNMSVRTPGAEVSAAKLPIQCWQAGTAPGWDNLNVPVWAMVRDGFLFVRTVSPRIGVVTVDVIEGGTLDMVPSAFDVATFIDEID